MIGAYASSPAAMVVSRAESAISQRDDRRR
jgi:hypothetical protein